MEAAATNTMAQLSDVQRHLSRQIDAGTVAVKAQTLSIAAAVMYNTDAEVAIVNTHTTQEVASLHVEVARLTDIVVFMAQGKLPQAVRASRGLARNPSVPTGALQALSAMSLPPAVRHASTAPTRMATAAANVVPVALLKDRDNVRQLQVQNKLNGVLVYDENGHCVPLLSMEKNLSWKEALDEYAVGLCGRASIREVEQRFGLRWRLLVPDQAVRTSIGKLYCSRLALYCAFDKEYARSHSEGVAGVLSPIKRTFNDIRGSKAA